MRVTYTPDGQDAQVWDFDPDNVLAVEAEAIEERTDQTWDEFAQSVMSGRTRSRRALLWHLLKRQHPPLRFDDVAFRTGELKVEFERHELERLLETIRKNDAVPEDQRTTAIRTIESQLRTMPEAPGKAPSLSDE